MTATRRRASGLVPSTPIAGPSIVITSDNADLLHEHMSHLLESTVASVLGEIVVVPVGQTPSTDFLEVHVARWRREHPESRLRLASAGAADLATARGIGVRAARGTHVLLLGERVAAVPLGPLLRGLAPGDDVVLARVDVESGTPVLTGADAIALLDGVEGVLIPTDLARHLMFEADARRDDPAAWLPALGLREVSVCMVPVDSPDTDAGGDLDPETLLDDLARLEHSPVDGPRGEAARRVLLDSRAQRLNTWLRQHPSDHTRIVEGAAERTLRCLDWSVVNAGIARDLAVCYLFPPALDTSGLVAAKRLRERGIVTDVITHDLSSLRAMDPDSLLVPGSALGRVHTMPGKASFAGWGHISSFAAEAWDTMVAWEMGQGEYRSVYSRAMPPAAHYAAALMKTRRPALRWIAEFSDPLDLNPLGEHRRGPVGDDWLHAELRAALEQRGVGVEPELRLFEWCERVAYALADEIIFTNENQRRLMLDHCVDPVLAARALEISRVSAHPMLPPDCYELAEVSLERKPGTVQLGYFGVFYATRDLGDVASALLKLTQDERDRIRLHVFTTDPDALAVRLAGLGLGGTVITHGYRPFHQFLALTREFDVLIVDDARTREHHEVNPYLPSKLADYRGSGTPIWAIAEPGSILGTLQHDYQSTLGDHDGAVAVLRTIIDRHRGRTP